MADDIDYQAAISGHDEPEHMWGSGKVFIELARRLGDNDPRDSDGDTIDPSMAYYMNKTGIYKYYGG